MFHSNYVFIHGYIILVLDVSSSSLINIWESSMYKISCILIPIPGFLTLLVWRGLALVFLAMCHLYPTVLSLSPTIWSATCRRCSPQPHFLLLFFWVIRCPLIPKSSHHASGDQLDSYSIALSDLDRLQFLRKENIIAALREGQFLKPLPPGVVTSNKKVPS